MTKYGKMLTPANLETHQETSALLESYQGAKLESLGPSFPSPLFASFSETPSSASSFGKASVTVRERDNRDRDSPCRMVGVYLTYGNRNSVSLCDMRMSVGFRLYVSVGEYLYALT